MLNIYKAQATGDKAVDDVQISISAAFPDMYRFEYPLKAAEALFSKEAECLEEALHASLPGGTYDHLLGKMLARKASHFVVSHRD